MTNDAIFAGPDTDRLGADYLYEGCNFNAKGCKLILNDLMNTLAKVDRLRPALENSGGSN